MPTLLAQVVRATATAASADAVLDRVARVLARQVSWVLADRLDEPDLVTRVCAYAGDEPLALPAGMGGVSARRSSAGSAGILPLLRASPQRLLRVDAQQLHAMATGPDAHSALQASTALSIGTVELVLLGLVARDALVGVVTLGRRTAFHDDEVAELADVALHVGVALDAVRLLAVQREVATAMQTSLLPPVPAVDGLRLAARYSPATHGLDVGGDWYDAFPTGGGLVVVVGDVRGHDLPAAARMADLRNLLRAHAVDRAEPPSHLVARLERTAGALGVEVDATCVVGRLTRAADCWQLVWTSAGHPPPVLFSAGRAVLLETEPDLMLGVEDDVHRGDHVQRLVDGDVLVLYTDGLVERRDSPLGDRLELLRSLVQQHAGDSPDELSELLLAQLAGSAEDDVALLVVLVG